MKALLCQEHGGPETLVLAEVAPLQAAPGKVVISVAACGINFPDTLIIRNLYQFKPALPFAPGGEVAGIVKEVGAGVTHLQAGDRVFALCGWGGLAEEVEVDARRVFPLLPEMDFVTGAAVMYNYGTSYHALKDRAGLQAGETLLVLGAGGGVGLAAVELGKLPGATVIAAASSEAKLAVCQAKGADFTINYATADLRASLKEITHGRGVDVVYDPVGDKYAEPAVRSLAWRGRYLVVGFAGGEIPRIPLNLVLLKGGALVGVFWGRFAETEAGRNLRNMQELAGFFRSGKLRPHLHKLYPLAESAQALTDLLNRQVIGKAVVVMGPETPAPAMAAEAPPPVAPGVKKEGEPLVFRNLAELQDFSEATLGVSEWLEISQEMIDGFAAATGDFQWLHTDEARAAAESPFGGTIAHGFNVLALAPQFLYRMFVIESAGLVLNYGCNKVRFIVPVPVRSRVQMSAALQGVEEVAPGRAKLSLAVTFRLEGQEKPCCVAELISLVVE